MLDLFTIFSKGGIVLWCFQSTQQSFTNSVNTLIKSVILQERGGSNSFTHEALTLKYKLDNEFELVFVVAYQKILQLAYIDKFLNAIQIEFRDKYKDDLKQGKISRNFEFNDTFQDILQSTEEAYKQELKVPKKMKSFDQSVKSKKTVASMIVSKTEEPQGKGKKKGKTENKLQVEETVSAPVTNGNQSNGELEDTIMKNRAKLFAVGKKKAKAEKKSPAVTEESKKKSKERRQWNLSGDQRDHASLDFSKENGDPDGNEYEPNIDDGDRQQVGQMGGELRPIEPESSSEDEQDVAAAAAAPAKAAKAKAKSGGFGFLNGLRGLVGSKTLTRESIEPVLTKMKEHLIAKNVAVEIADKLCESIATKLEGRVLGTFNTVAAAVKQSLQEACVQILSPKRRVDILREAMDAKQQRRPYTVTFCGVNGVGKSTNLAKVCFWLVENGFRVLIAACDTFRAGAVEQLRVHCRKLNALHPPEAHQGMQMVQLYEKGYGKDAAGIAMEAINFARDMRVDVVLIDTAGRMQDNEPLMRALSKLIKVNQPDLVLFVGEALVGNEAIDQLTKFNQALADHSNMEKPHIIDGILLTKFDTIDDQVGAAISMTYITGQPIVFVGTGQTYTDLKNLNAKAVVHALLK